MAERTAAEQIEWLKVQGKMDPKKREAVNGDAADRWLRESAELTDHLARVIRVFATERGLTQDQGAFGVALLCCNARNDFPAEEGGTKRFDACAAYAQEYFNKNKG